MCVHDWIDQDGEEVCIECGLVGQPVYSSSDMPDLVARSSEVEDGGLHFLRDELTEIIMRLSGGDCTRTHVDTIMGKLMTWHAQGSKQVQDLISHPSPSPQHTSRGVLAVAVHRGLLANGRQETLDHIGSVVGATRHAVITAERLLKEPREYLQSPVLVRKVVDSIAGLSPLWADCIKALAEHHVQFSFREVDVVVAATAMHLARLVKAHLAMNKENYDRSVLATTRANLRVLTGASLCRQLVLTYSTVNRASRTLDSGTLDMAVAMPETLVSPAASAM